MTRGITQFHTNELELGIAQLEKIAKLRYAGQLPDTIAATMKIPRAFIRRLAKAYPLYKTCLQCGNPFEIAGLHGYKSRLYCSKECLRQGRIVVARARRGKGGVYALTEEQIVEAITLHDKMKYSWDTIAPRMGVCARTLLRAKKRYNHAQSANVSSTRSSEEEY